MRRGEGPKNTSGHRRRKKCADSRHCLITRSEIESLTSTGRSIMPEGFEQQVDLQGVANLLAYLTATP